MSEKRNFRILICLIFILFFALIAIGYLAYKNHKLSKKLDYLIENTNNLFSADASNIKSQDASVQPVKKKDSNSKYTFILSIPIKSDYHIGKTYGFYKNSKTNELELHEGIDFVVVSGTPVYSASDGIVTEVGYNNELGNYITISHPKGFKTRYCNLSSFRVKKGQFVSTEKKIANVGNTGISDEPHLGFLLYDPKGNLINPAEYLKELINKTNNK